MRCPYCGHIEDKVVDSRESAPGDTIRRRRECLKCERRFTTYEHIEQVPLMIIKRDGRREPFDRNKILSGLLKACGKRPISVDQVENVADQIERAVRTKYDKEVNSTIIGEAVINKLKKIDEIAYVRFASVYRQFKDVNQFMSELEQAFKSDKKKKKSQ